jgi:hypothetical protein
MNELKTTAGTDQEAYSEAIKVIENSRLVYMGENSLREKVTGLYRIIEERDRRIATLEMGRGAPVAQDLGDHATTVMIWLFAGVIIGMIISWLIWSIT